MNATVSPPATGPTMQERLARLSTHGLVACLPPQYIQATVQRAMEAEKITPGQERAVARKDGAIAVVSMRGVIVPREDRYSQYFGEIGAENIADRVRAAVADARVKAIVLDIDSPGGSVNGLTEANAAIRALRGKKPIVAHADWNMASAAYWIGCAADEIVASPSAQVGSVGVITWFADVQEQMKMLGMKVTPYSKPDDKADGWGMWENTEKFDARMKQEIADAYEQFVSDIAACRSIDRAKVLADWAGYYVAKRAKLYGMVDKVRPMSETFAAYTNAANSGATSARNKLAVTKLKGKN